MGAIRGGMYLERNRHGRWILLRNGKEVPPFVSLPFLFGGLYLLWYPGQNWLDHPDTERSVETTLSVADYWPPARPGESEGVSKKWVWTEVDGKIYRCASDYYRSEGWFKKVPVVFESDNPSKCREASIMGRPSFTELWLMVLGSVFTGVGLTGLLLTPSWYRRRQNLYDGILEDDVE